MNNNDHITNEELLEDIKETEIEAEAYRMLAEAYRSLATLKDNTQADRNAHRTCAKINNISYEACRNLLAQLNKLKTDRGI